MLSLKSTTATNKATRESNQDRVFGKSAETSGLFCIADGMGGHKDGEHAASVAIATIEEWWSKFQNGTISPKGAEILDAFFSIFQSINDSIRLHVQKTQALSGTTCSVLMIQDKQYYIAHTGDSRIYYQESRWFSKLYQITEDHSNKGRLTSCLGTFKRPKIFTQYGNIDRPCNFLLCSDGLYRMVPSGKISAILKTHKNKTADKLVNYALKQGASDNVSAVVVKIGGS